MLFLLGGSYSLPVFYLLGLNPMREDQVERRKIRGTMEDRRYSLPQIRVAIEKILDRPEMLPYMREQLKSNLQLELLLNEPPRGISNR
jgi:hypothetical protein